jgi:3-dehydrosphinganine reductase
MDFFSGKVTYITGGSSGIGLAAAKLVAKAGGKVAISARGKERLDAALAEIKAVAPGVEAIAIACDVSDPADSRRAAAEVLAAFGRCDVVIANAGVAHCMRIADTDDEAFERMMRINYLGTVHTVRAFLPHMTERRRGAIGIVSSLLGFMGTYGYSAYAPSKFAQVGFAECLRQELIEFGVSVTLLYPPDTDTPQLAAENLTKPAETKAISGNVKTLPPEAVALPLLQGIARGKLTVVPGGMGKFAHFMKRHAPSVVNWVIDGDLKKFQKKRTQA